MGNVLRIAAVVLLVGCPGNVWASTTSLNFDSVIVAPGTCTSADSYLASFGITFSAVTPGTAGTICNVSGTPVTASSGINTFQAQPQVTNTDLSFDLFFSTPLTELTFTRAAVDSVTALPPWDAIAFNASNVQLDSIIQPIIFPGPPAATFSLSGSDITRVRFDGFNGASPVTYNFPHLDNFVLQTAAVPEETNSLVLLAVGLLVVALAVSRWS